MPFILEWLVLVLPLSFALTVYADAPGVLSVLLLAPTCVLLLLPQIEGGTHLLSKTNETQPSATARDSGIIDGPAPPALRPLPALTTYRANMMLMTVFSILAVDFPVFPRSLAKCETYGVSLVRADLHRFRRSCLDHVGLDGLWSRVVRFLSGRRFCDTPHQGSVPVACECETKIIPDNQKDFASRRVRCRSSVTRERNRIPRMLTRYHHLNL